MIRMKYKGDSHYESYDGQWTIWREPYPPRRWYINQTGYDETLVAEGFGRRMDAMRYLSRLVEEE